MAQYLIDQYNYELDELAIIDYIDSKGPASWNARIDAIDQSDDQVTTIIQRIIIRHGELITQLRQQFYGSSNGGEDW